jgi:aspartyl-tRNA(Asn)/glutamyl-tRNA(Gln) amidotransferase subunit B
VKSNTINRGTAKKVFAELFTHNIDPDANIKKHNQGIVTDDSALRAQIAQVLAANEKSVGEYKSGKTQALQYLIGQSMRALKGQAPAQEVTRILQDLLS